MYDLICINGKFYRVATLDEIKSGVAIWTGNLFLVLI